MKLKRPSRMIPRTAAALSAALLVAGGLGLAVAPPAAAAVVKHDDFNGDGYRDLVVGAPSATIEGHRAAGYVAVLYGSKSGISTARKVVISQATSGVPGSPETGDAFGEAVASGDFDADGYADLAVGVPGEDLGTVTDAGGIAVLWGSASGLSGAQSTGLQADVPESGDEFGKALVTGRFGDAAGSGLAVLANSRLTEFRGGDTAATARTLRLQGRSAVRTLQENGIVVTGLTAGNFDGDEFTDLAMHGVLTGEEDGQGWSAWFKGTAAGLEPQVEFQGGPTGAAGDLNQDGYDDLVTGEPAPPGDEAAQGGKVEIWYGTARGPMESARTWTQDSAGVPGVGERGDRWGGDLSVEDVNGDGYLDLAVGAEMEDIGTVADAGAVWLLRGSATGVTVKGVQDFNQDSADVPGVPEKLDRFGAQVRLFDGNWDGKAGLIASAPGENSFDGYCWAFTGTSGGLTASGSWTFGGASLGAPSANAQFGSTLGE